MDGNMQQPERPQAAGAPESHATIPLLNEYLSLITSSNTLEGALGNVAALSNTRRVYQLIADMDSAHWPTRERATRTVSEMGMPAAPHLSNALESNTLTLEQRRRVQQSLDTIVRAQPLQSLFSHLTNETSPGHLQRLIREHAASRVERNQPY